jgi:hypothetical protein
MVTTGRAVTWCGHVVWARGAAVSGKCESIYKDMKLIRVYVCVRVWVSGCARARMYVCVGCIHVRLCVCACACACASVRRWVHVCICVGTRASGARVCKWVPASASERVCKWEGMHFACGLFVLLHVKCLPSCYLVRACIHANVFYCYSCRSCLPYIRLCFGIGVVPGVVSLVSLMSSLEK